MCSDGFNIRTVIGSRRTQRMCVAARRCALQHGGVCCSAEVYCEDIVADWTRLSATDGRQSDTRAARLNTREGETLYGALGAPRRAERPRQDD